MKRVIHNQGGFSIVEAVIATGILTVGILAVASMQSMATRLNTTAYELTEDVTWCQDTMEWLLGLPYDDANLDPATNPHTAGIHPPGYPISWTIEDVDSTPPYAVPDAKRIILTVWMPDGVTPKFQLTTIKARTLSS